MYIHRDLYVSVFKKKKKREDLYVYVCFKKYFSGKHHAF